MKIAVRGGHCPKSTGAVGLINELTEDRLMKDSAIKYLKLAGHEVLDVTSPDSTPDMNNDLKYGVNKANQWGAELFLSFHFNNRYKTYEGAIGSEICVFSPFDKAQKVLDAIVSFGFKNRGQKVRTDLYELKHTKMPSMIIETCFVEATEDVKLYKKVGYDAIAKKIAEAINGKTIVNEPIKEPVQEPVTKPSQQAPVKDEWVARLQAECNKQGFSKQVVDGIPGTNTLKGCPMLKRGATGNITKLLQERLKISADGIFGADTEKAVKSYQSSKKLVADGIVGQGTWAKLLGL